MSQEPDEPQPISTFYVLVPLVLPVVCFMLGSRHSTRGHAITDPRDLVWMGAGAFLVGLWSGWCAYSWRRLSPGFQRAWRPHSQASPALLALIFGAFGAWTFVKNIGGLFP